MSTHNPIIESLRAAQAAFRAGDMGKALEMCGVVLTHVPSHPIAHLLKGLLLQQNREHGEAIHHLRFAIAHNPDDIDVRDALAMCLLELHRPAEAVPHLRKVISAQPENTTARYNLGRALLDMRQFAEAEEVYAEHVSQCPGDAEGFNHLGIARLARGDSRGAEQCFRSALKLNEQDPLFHVNLAQSLAHQAQVGEAGQAYLRAIELDPRSAGFRVSHGWFCLWAGDLTRSEDRFREALTRDPDCESASAGLAAVLERREELQVAMNVLRPHISAVRPNPKVAISYARVSGRMGQPEVALPVVRRALRPGIAKREEAGLRFAEGDLLDMLGQSDAAFDAYTQGKAAQDLEFDEQNHKRYIDALIETFDADLFQALPKPQVDTTASVLVVGMPRSGTSLVEQILSTHPVVHGAGELDDMLHMAHSLGRLIPGDDGYPRNISRMDAGLVERLATDRMDRLAAISDAMLVIDKLPHNFMHLGLAAVVTPGVRVIHCVRDPIDTCLSCYFQHFAGAQFTFSSRLESLASFYREYHRLMRHWERVLPVPMMTVRYEDMVQDTEGTSRNLLEFLGVDWDPAVLRFHDNDRVVSTASYAQVKKPIYSSSVGRAESYRHRLGPLVALDSLRG